ncbi:MAG: acyltransferase family protein [Bacteroidales bacterium]
METTKKRFEALDILRGLTIVFMIIVNNPGSWAHIYAPLRHAEWHGFTPTDLVFPTFLFIVGASCFFAFKKFDYTFNTQSFKKILVRTLLIFGMGLFLNYFPFYNKHIEDLRIMGVLQRIALAYFFASILILLLRSYTRIIITILVILFGYWAILYFGAATHPYSLEYNVVGRIDRLIFGASHLYKGYGIPFDPEGILSTLPSIATVMIGYISSKYIATYYNDNREMTVAKCFVIGGVLMALGYVWCFVLPINKPIWTSSYVLYAGGWSLLIYAIVLWICEKNNSATKLLNVFKTVGYNPMIIFVLSGIFAKLMSIIKVGDISLHAYIYSNIFVHLGDKFGSLMFALTYTSLFVLLAHVMARKNLILKF